MRPCKPIITPGEIFYGEKIERDEERKKRAESRERERKQGRESFQERERGRLRERKREGGVVAGHGQPKVVGGGPGLQWPWPPVVLRQRERGR